MRNSISKQITFWLSVYPESYHPCDMERFYSIFDECKTKDDVYDLLAIDLRSLVKSNKEDWDEEYIDNFCEIWMHNISLCANLILHQIEE